MSIAANLFKSQLPNVCNIWHHVPFDHDQGHLTISLNAITRTTAFKLISVISAEE